jgi:hypothetical protein
VELQIFQENERVAIATWNDVLISIWRSDVEPDDLKPAEEAQAALMEAHPRYATLAVAEAGALRMSSEARKEAARMTRLGQKACNAVAVVIGVEGFRGAAVRAAITAVNLISGARVPQRSFGQVDPAAAWLLERLQRTPSALPELVAAVKRVR